MDPFPRIDLFTPREKRFASVLAVTAIAIAISALVYVRPISLPLRTSSHAPQPTPHPRVFVTVASASARTSYVTVLQDFSAPAIAFRTLDGGRTWRRVSFPKGTTGFDLGTIPDREADVILTTYRQGFGLEAGTRSWLSRDRGDHWTPIATPCDHAPHGFSFPDAQHWYCVTFGPAGYEIHESADEGATWKLLLGGPGAEEKLGSVSVGSSISVTYGAGAVWLVVNSTSRAAGPDLRLFRSEDDGATWKAAALPLATAAPGQAVGLSLPQFASNGRGWTTVYVSPNGDIPRPRPDPFVSTTTDGGLTWSPLRLLQHGNFVPLSGASDWWSTAGAMLYRSSDLGKTWTATMPSMPTHMQLDAVYRATEQVAWGIYGLFNGGPVAGEPDRTYLLKTTDGGRSWSEVSLPGL